MSTIERERRVEFSDGMDELPSLDNDVENLCEMLEDADPRTAAILRRRYEKKGLMKAETTTPPLEPLKLGLQALPRLAPLPPPKPVAKPVEQTIVANKLEQKVLPASTETERKSFERKSFERKSFERKSWADMSTDSEDENLENVVSFASSDEGNAGTVGTQLTWDPIGAEVSVAGFTPSPKGTFWLEVWQKMTGKSIEKELGTAQEPMAAPQATPAATPPVAFPAPEAMSPESDKGQGLTGYLPCQPTVMNAQRLPVLQAVQAVQAVPVQPMMMLFAPSLGTASPGTSFNFIPVSEAKSFHSVHSVQSEPEVPPISPLPGASCFHMKTAQLGQLSPDRRSFTKTKSKGRLSIASTDRLYNCGVARYCVQFVSGELSNADGVGIVFSSQLPCPQNIQRIISIFANRTGRICMRADADVERSHVNIKAMELGDWLEVVCDFDHRKVTFSVWPADGGNVSSATVDFSGASDRFRRLSAQVPSCAAGYLAVVLKHPGLTVTLGDA